MIKANGDRIEVQIPYSPALIEKFKQIDGKRYDPDRKVWTFPFYVKNELGSLLNADLSKIDWLSKINIPEVEGLELRKHQALGITFLVNRRKCILADGVGMGKTIQTLVALKYLILHEHVMKAIIIVMNQSVEQWREEIINKLHYDPENVIVAGKNHSADYQNFRRNPRALFLIVNYEKMIIDDFEEMIKLKKVAIVLDEATRVKNYFSAGSRKINLYRAEYLFLLTGTPIENSPLDLYNLFSILDNGYLPNFYKFKEEYAIVETLNVRGKSIDSVVGWKNLEDLKRKTSPLILQRKREQVGGLPPLEIKDVLIEISPQERMFYELIEDEIRRRISRGKESVFSLFTVLKQFLDDSSLLYTSKVKYLKNFNIDKIQTESSKKLKALDIVKHIKDQKIIIFTQFERMARILNQEIPDSIVYAKGSDEKVLKDFKADYKVLISTDKGNYSLNLQEASVVINYDLPWNPARLEQRYGRIWRDGQTRKCTVYNFIVTDEDKIEKYVKAVLLEKQEYSKEVLQ